MCRIPWWIKCLGVCENGCGTVSVCVGGACLPAVVIQGALLGSPGYRPLSSLYSNDRPCCFTCCGGHQCSSLSPLKPEHKWQVTWLAHMCGLQGSNGQIRFEGRNERNCVLEHIFKHYHLTHTVGVLPYALQQTVGEMKRPAD